MLFCFEDFILIKGSENVRHKFSFLLHISLKNKMWYKSKLLTSHKITPIFFIHFKNFGTSNINHVSATNLSMSQF